MKKVANYLPIIIIVAFFTGIYFFYQRFFGDRVEQMLFTYGGSTSYNTYVWVDRKIVVSWHNNPVTLTDSAKQAQMKEGLRILKLTKTKLSR